MHTATFIVGSGAGAMLALAVVVPGRTANPRETGRLTSSLVLEHDVRPRHSLSRQQDIAEGVQWRDPDRVQDWMGELSKSEPVVVYCAYGFHVGCGMAVKLHEAGYDARYMNSGHSGWKAIGAPVRLEA